MNLWDYGLWIGEEADALLGVARENRERASRVHLDSLAAVAAKDSKDLWVQISNLDPNTATSVVMDLITTVLNLESQLLYYQLKEMRQ